MDDTTTSTNTQDDLPDLPPDSPGSSVSSRLQEEYDEILKYAVVIPSYNPKVSTRTLTDAKGSFLEEEPPREPPNPAANTDRRLAADGVAAADGVHHKSAHISKSARNQEHAVDDVIDDPIVVSCHDDDSNPRPDVSPLDTDFDRMETVLDHWTFELKKSVMAELRRLKLKLSEDYQRQLVNEKARLGAATYRLEEELNTSRHMLETYELSVQRKDGVISNLSKVLQHQKDKLTIQKRFYEWKVQHIDAKRESFTTVLANSHYERVICRNVFAAWRSVIVEKWRHHVEKACQAKAKDVCLSLTNDYEARIVKLTEDLESCRAEVSRLNQERTDYEATMKKAFMRGVCALNVEAMNMFHESERREFRDTLQTIADFTRRSSSPDHQGEMTTTPCPRIHTAQPCASAQRQDALVQTKTVHFATSTKPVVTPGSKTPKHAGVKCPSRLANVGAVPLAPPMSSIVVERHQPVNKQTLQHALVSQFPRDQENIAPTTAPPLTGAKAAPQSHSAGAGVGAHFRKIAGQADSGPSKTIAHVTTVKVVD